MKRNFWWIAAVAATVALTGCFGDDDSPAPAPKATDQLAPSASTSSAGLVAYIVQLIRETNEGIADAKEPVDVSGFMPQEPNDLPPEDIPTDIS